ncbi:MAG: hypothetical protein Q8R26_00565 [bacterium]|nr:hypothetical protein [bacterium]
MKRLGLELKKPYWAVLEVLEGRCNQLTELLNSLSLDLKNTAKLLEFGGKREIDKVFIQGFRTKLELVNLVCYIAELSNVLWISEIPEEDVEELIARLKICQRKLTLLKAPIFEEATRELFATHIHLRPLCTIETTICRLASPENVLKYMQDLVTNILFSDEEVKVIFCAGIDKGVDFSQEEDGVVGQILHLISEHRPAVYEKLVKEQDDGETETL